MQVQPSMYTSHAPLHSSNQHSSHTNGTSDSRQYNSASTNGHFQEGEMYPYQQNQYPVGHGHGPPQPQQQQHQQYQANQLPPMYVGNSAPPPSMAPPPAPSMAGMSGQGGSTQAALYPAEPAATSSNPFPGPGQSRLDDAPKSQVGNNGKYKFELKVEQQPKRARMCGFGDKDRRPITPPPCIRLIITDAYSGKKISPGEDLDGMFFVLQVDLWDESATREVNIVRSSSAQPSVSISQATTTSYPPTPLARETDNYQPQGLYRAVEVPAHQPMYGQQPGYSQMGMAQPMAANYGYQNNMGGYYTPVGQQYGNSPIVPAPYPSPSYVAPPPTTNHNMYTRNLIGSLTVNASQLKDTDDELGFWFVLQDLSIRTEGVFRLRCNFIDVGDGTGQLNKSKAPVLAFVYSESFQVFSAKKFPGVIESTPLSKKFAAQGIKIPIRKENKNERNDDEDDE